MRKMLYKNNVTNEITTSYNIAKEWTDKQIFFEDIEAPKGFEELELEKEAKEYNIKAGIGKRSKKR